MSIYALTPLAKSDVFAIWSYIAQDDREIADRVEQTIYQACEFIAESPLTGHIRSDLTHRALRFWTLPRYPNYMIVYRPETNPLEVIAILHGQRNLRRVLSGRH